MKPQYQNEDRKMSSWVKIERQTEKRTRKLVDKWWINHKLCDSPFCLK